MLTLISLVSDNGRFPAAVCAAVDANQTTIARILKRAKDEGVVRADVTVEEFFFVVRGLAQAAATMPARPGTLDRAIEIVLRGLTPTA
jgi:hypothetical protein